MNQLYSVVLSFPYANLFLLGLISLLVISGRMTEQTILEVANAHAVIEAEMAATTTSTATQPGVGGEEDTARSQEGHVGVFDKGDFDVEEELDKGRNGIFGLDCARRGDNLLQGFHDGGAADADVVASGGLVPVATGLQRVS